jgi:alkylhydroperoxidase family enzyme
MSARAWVNGTLDAVRPAGADGDDAVADARRMGADEETIAALVEWQAHQDGLADEAGMFKGVWPEHVNAVSAFLAACTQWRTILVQAGERFAVQYTGLDYAGAAIAWSARKIEVAGDLFDQFTILELAARDGLNGVKS